MPSLRKVIEELEYSTLPSSTRADFGTTAAVATAGTNEVAVTEKRANGDTNGKQAVSPERLAFEDPEKSSNVDFRKAVREAFTEETGRKPVEKTIIQSLNKEPSQNDIVVLSDDEEEISLQDLAKLKEIGSVAISTASKTIEKVVVRPVEKNTVQVRGSVSNSVPSVKKTSLSAAHHIPKKADQSLATTVSIHDAQEGVNSGEACGARAMDMETDPSVADSLVAAAPPSIQNELTASTWTADLSSIVPRTKGPYLSNPTVRKNATVVLQNIRSCLENSMPTQQKVFQTSPLGPTATMPGMERWSECRIDSAATIDDLESIRRRLLTLTDRVNLRLQEMRFLDAIGMTENDEGFRKRDSIEDIIRSWTDHIELSSSDETKSRGNSSNTEVDSNRKRPESNSGGSGKNATTANPCKRQRSSCCPFCLNTNVTPEDNAYSTCAICDESSNICLNCRVYCSDCHRLTCEDCLMMCDTCFSGICCSDCMEKTGRCRSCSKKKPTTISELPKTARANGKLLQKVLKGQEKETPPPILQTRATDHSLHRFIITEKRALGLTINDNKTTGTATIRHVQEKSIAESIGLRLSDQICLPFTNGAQPSNLCKPSYCTTFPLSFTSFVSKEDDLV
ncbi:hypothetical protein ACHAWX_002672 [Stephanocyclus meneghinianus]